MKLIVAIPAYNEASIIGSVIERIPSTLPGIREILMLVIDDGSTDATAQIAEAAGALVLSHPLNGGVGVAKVTGFTVARQLNADITVTMDADGQHDPANLTTLIAPIISGEADIAAGTRLKDPTGMPTIRLLGNRTMNALLRIVWGVKTTDSQSGYRAYSRESLEHLEIEASGFEVDTEILIAARRNNLAVVEIPVRTIYTNYSKTKGQSVSTALMTFFRLIKQVITG